MKQAFCPSMSLAIHAHIVFAWPTKAVTLQFHYYDAYCGAGGWVL